MFHRFAILSYPSIRLTISQVELLRSAYYNHLHWQASQSDVPRSYPSIRLTASQVEPLRSAYYTNHLHWQASQSDVILSIHILSIPSDSPSVKLSLSAVLIILTTLTGRLRNPTFLSILSIHRTFLPYPSP